MRDYIIIILTFRMFYELKQGNHLENLQRIHVCYLKIPFMIQRTT